MSARSSLVFPALLMLACAAPPRTGEVAEPVAEPIAATTTMPEHLAPIVDEWWAGFLPHFHAARMGRSGAPGAWRWTDEERAALETLRERARATLDAATPADHPWLLASYSQVFYQFGIGSEWTDALLEIPPEHPVWALRLGSLLDRAWEASDPARVEALIHAVAERHDNPTITAESLFLQLREADRVGDWDLARELIAKIDAIDLGTPGQPRSASSSLNADFEGHHPERMLSAATTVPHFCAPTLADSGTERLSLDALFPYADKTLIVGSSSWCPPCREVMPKVIESAREQGLRVILISHDESLETVIAYRAEYAIEDWLTFVPHLEPLDRNSDRIPGDLKIRSIPFMALVDDQGTVELSTPWLDVEVLAAMR